MTNKLNGRQWEGGGKRGKGLTHNKHSLQWLADWWCLCMGVSKASDMVTAATSCIHTHYNSRHLFGTRQAHRNGYQGELSM